MAFLPATSVKSEILKFVSFQSKSEEGEQQDKRFENCEMRMKGFEVIAFVRRFAQNTT